MKATHFEASHLAKNLLTSSTLVKRGVFWSSKKLLGLTAVGLMSVIVSQSPASAELVSADSQSIDAQTPARISDRNLMRQNLQTAQRVQPAPSNMDYSAIENESPVIITPPPVVQSPIYSAPAPIYVPAPQQVYPAPQPLPQQQYYAPQQQQMPLAQTNTEVEALSRSELLRRNRVREELKNEDLLQERLESLRLKDEQSRTDSLIGGKTLNEMGSAQSALNPVESPVVVAPVNNAVNNPPLQTSVIASDGTQTVTVAQNNLTPLTPPSAVTPVQGVSMLNEESEEIRFSLTPRGGVGGLMRNQAFRVNSRYSVGVEGSIEVTPHASFEFGYTFSELGVAMTQSNPYVLSQSFQNGRFETIAMKQNLFDMGMKLYLTKPQARIRPFIGGGVGYSRSFINYDSQILNTLYQYGQSYSNYARDYELNSFLGKLSAGLDVKITKSISIVGSFNYYHVLSSRENAPLNNNAFYYGNTAASYTPYGYSMYSPGAAYNNGNYYNAYGNTADERQYVSSSLSRAAFYNVLSGIQFSF